MGTNEISKLNGLTGKKQEQQAKTPVQDNKSIEVFASNNVGAVVDLKADENNSLFNKTTYVRTNRTLSEIESAETVKISELSDDIKTKYSPKEQELLKTLTTKQLEQAQKLMDTKLKVENIVQIVQSFSADKISQIKTKVDAIQDVSGGKDNVFGVAFTSDAYDKDAYKLNALNYNFELRSELMDKNLKTRSVETLSEKTDKDGKTFRILDTNDMQNGTLSKIRFDKDETTKMYVAAYELRSTVDKESNMVSREMSTKSKIKGVMDTEVLTEDGTDKVTKSKVKNSGKVNVTKNMTSPDGTETKYSYKESPNGDRVMKYKITTADGEVLMDNKKSFKVISDTEFKSTFNDKSYTMKIENGELKVQNDNDESQKASFKFDDIAGEKDVIVNLLKKMTGDELMDVSKSTNSFEGIKNQLESYYNGQDKSIHTGEDLFIALHELGHAKDFKEVDVKSILTLFKSSDHRLSHTEEFKKTYEQELANFLKAYPNAQREHIDYFINSLSHYGGPDGGKKETIAESNAIQSTPMSHEVLALRTQYLQQNFPRTIAKLNDMFNREGTFYEPVDDKIELPKSPTVLPKLNLPKTN